MQYVCAAVRSVKQGVKRLPLLLGGVSIHYDSLDLFVVLRLLYYAGRSLQDSAMKYPMSGSFKYIE